jgi:hypothetical protein
MTMETTGGGYTGASSVCVHGAVCTAGTSNAIAEDNTVTITATTCDGDATTDGAATGCMAILVFLVLYV